MAQLDIMNMSIRKEIAPMQPKQKNAPAKEELRPALELETRSYKFKLRIVPFLRPTVIVDLARNKSESTGVLTILGQKIQLELVERRKNSLVLVVAVDMVAIELVINLESDNSCSGVVDTPIGHFRFEGSYQSEEYEK